jgi:CheY-like chemotaxis protein/HPt (histidine-containing phosphotransfer) domain-containing protein
MSTREPAPRLLLVEDDPVSAAFLAAALADLGELSQVGSLAAAIDAVCAVAPAALICDCRLPDGHASQLPTALGARACTLPPAIALSADVQQGDVALLQAAGFGAVLAKPISATALRQAVLGLLGKPAANPWDDSAADAALGLPPAQRRQLRQLLLQELPLQRDRIAAAIANGDRAVLDAELHRLKASCGFCGARTLGAAAAALRAIPDALHWRAFDDACGALLTAGGDTA